MPNDPTTLAAVMIAAGAPLELREYPLPAVGPADVLVRITCATICPSDLHTWRGRRPGPTPAILGHEAVGVVEQLGAERRRDSVGQPLAIGDRVTWTLHSSCGECDYCTRHELPMKCRRLRKFGHQSCESPPHLFGAMAERCLLDAGTGVLRLPDALDDLAATPANCAAATAIAACDAGDVQLARSVLIQGCGALGVYACAYTSMLGCDTVIATDMRADRLETARRFGATQTICLGGRDDGEIAEETRRLVGPDGVDAVLGFTGSPAAFALGLERLRVGGVFVEVGSVFPGAPAPLCLRQLVAKSLTIRGVHNYKLEHLRRAVGFLAETGDRFDWPSVVGRVFPLREANQAFEAAEAGEFLRVAIRM